MENLRIFLYFAICSCAFAKIKIYNLDIPAQIERGQTDHVVLDCKFQVENSLDATGLILKWFFQDNNLVYQWFPGKPPQFNKAWINRVDSNYSASNDPNTKYRALKITNLTTDITGEYTCKVTSDYSEASSAKTMIIYEPPKSLVFEHIDNASTLLCSASDTFPKPAMRIYPLDYNSTDLKFDYEEDNDILIDEADVNSVEESQGLYNVTTSFQYDPAKIVEPVVFVCEFSIPNTSFSRKLKRTIRPEEETTSTTSQYDYETTTAIQTTMKSENSASAPTWSCLLLSTVTLALLLR